MNDTRCKICFKQIFINICSLFIWNKFMIENLKFMALQSQYKKIKLIFSDYEFYLTLLHNIE